MRQLGGDPGGDVVEVDLRVVVGAAEAEVAVVADPNHVRPVDLGRVIVRIVVGQLESGVGDAVVKEDVPVGSILGLPDHVVTRDVVVILGLRTLVHDQARGRIDPEYPLAQVVQDVQVCLRVGPHQTEVVGAVAGIEADLGPGPAEAVGAVDVAGGPFHVVIDEGNDIAPRVVLNVKRKGVPFVGVCGEVAHVDPVDLDERMAVGSGSRCKADFPARSTGLPIGARIHVGPEGRNHLSGPGLRDGKPGREVLPIRAGESYVPVVVEIELREVVAVELKHKAQVQKDAGLVVLGRQRQGTRRYKVHLWLIRVRLTRIEDADRLGTPNP